MPLPHAQGALIYSVARVARSWQASRDRVSALTSATPTAPHPHGTALSRDSWRLLPASARRPPFPFRSNAKARIAVLRKLLVTRMWRRGEGRGPHPQVHHGAAELRICPASDNQDDRRVPVARITSPLLQIIPNITQLSVNIRLREVFLKFNVKSRVQ